MFKGSRPQVKRALENREKSSECVLGSDMGCNPDQQKVELAGYWSCLHLRVKKQSEVVDQEHGTQEVSS